MERADNAADARYRLLQPKYGGIGYDTGSHCFASWQEGESHKMFHLMMLLALAGLFAALGFGDALELTLRRRKESVPGTGQYETSYESVAWSADRTAFLVCDMWNQHWCVSASRRVEELAPTMNAALNAGRDRGVLILHAPSDTMAFYAATPQRERARSAPKVASEPEDISLWRPLDSTRESPLPIDDSDGGCDDLPPCPTYRAWTRQHPALEIAPEDAISDNGAEIYRLLEQQQIENVVVMGVHTNMCVLGRSFGIRRLVGLGKNVALMRDMTDSLYNPRKQPYVSHFHGTRLMVDHIETYWCPSITSDQITGGEPFSFQDAIG
ncbi:MAG: Isochorismatase family protein [Chthonomonadaceae bacterium]|nr:Isochorismatase family protein [Chthonomonadaceae bacterium]